VLNVTPDSAGWKHVGFRVVRLSDGQTFEGGDAGREACLVIVAGTADVVAGELRLDGLGGRRTPFEDRAPGAVYVPAGVGYSVTAQGAVELAVCTAPGVGQGEPRLIDAARMTREVRGTGTNTRYVRNILPETEAAEGLLVVEVITPGGHWSSYPPHKHDTASPRKRPRWRRPTTTASTRRRASPCSASTPTTAAWTRPSASRTATSSWCPAATTRSALRTATTSII
jgi:5-deoxy-glucuronate isomerase